MEQKEYPLPEYGGANRLYYAKYRAHLAKVPTPVTHHASYEALRSQAFEVGWDFARYGCRPDQEGGPVEDGYRAGLAHFGRDGALRCDIYERKWLRLRASANARGRLFDESVTPKFLKSIAVKHCPIRRVPLLYPDHFTNGPQPSVCSDDLWTIDRLNNEAGYIVGNLVVMSQLANIAKGSFGFDEARAMALAAEKERDGVLGGLNGEEWARLAAMAAIMDTKASLREIATFPRLSYPPWRVNLRSHPVVVQANLMVAVAHQQRHSVAGALHAWAACFPGKKIRHQAIDMGLTFGQTFHLLGLRCKFQGQPQWALEDCWREAVVWRAWLKFLRCVSDADLEAASKKMLRPQAATREWDERAGLNSAGFTREQDSVWDLAA